MSYIPNPQFKNPIEEVIQLTDELQDMILWETEAALAVSGGLSRKVWKAVSD